MDRFSFLNAAHTAYFEDTYEQYLKNPDRVEPSWRAFFQGFDFGLSQQEMDAEINDALDSGAITISQNVLDEFKVIQLIDGYRSRGHLFTKTNPVRERRQYKPTLELENFGLSDADLDRKFDAGEILGLGKSSLRDILRHVENIYCDSIGVEYMYIRNPEEIKWIQSKLNVNDNQPRFDTDKKKQILKKLNEAVEFERFLNTKYVGQKRFSIEGNESLIPGLDALIETAAVHGVKNFILGMAHRGRLNVLTNIFGKPVEDIFSEFDGKDYAQKEFDGDVKYHLGWTSNRTTDTGEKIELSIAPNPSHLETVGAVVEGLTRAKQDEFESDADRNKVLPIVIHGDAAIAGQGIVYEIIQMAQLDAYKTQGTIHIVVNNQVGFTTNYLDARSSTYCTDVGKVTLSPVLHVNADDAEAVVHAMEFAFEFRMQYGRDVFIDLLGYRKYGHNEGDEPRFTQPKLYKAISKHSNTRDLYSQELLQNGVIDNDHVAGLQKQYKAKLEKEFVSSREKENTIITAFMNEVWDVYGKGDKDNMLTPVVTGVKKATLKKVTEKISSLPEDKKFIRKIQRIIENRKTMWDEDKLDWSMGEHLAYGSLLTEGYNVRISGQDVERGTFSHRHAIVKVEDSEEEIVLHNNIQEGQGHFEVYNSHLSEYAVVGFEYGYAMARPKTLTIWEAQFGDFSNGAQIMLDQYISAGEDKWKTQNGLVMLLPHGYEGQGAEHSSARMERYLQLCADDNMIIANATTPANYFHLLRRQMHENFRKPLVVFTPKKLLRYPACVSKVSELTSGSFQTVIDDDSAFAKAKTLVFTQGKFYYELDKYRQENNREDVAIVRIEQLFPLPAATIDKLLKQYKNATDIVWAQEEPQNMGAYQFLLLHYAPSRNWRVCSRKRYAAPASGSNTRSNRRHNNVIKDVFNDLNK